MPEGITPEDLIHNIMDTLTDNKHQKQNSDPEKPVHHILGGGKSADVLLWRNKKISASVLGAATAFIWSHLLNRSPPCIVLSDELLVSIATTVGGEINRALGFLQNVGSRGDIKQLVVVCGSLLIAAIIGTWCNFFTVLYISFVAAHTLPVVYEKYDDQIDTAVYNVLGQLQNKYSKLDASVLSRIPKATGKKYA
nr:reticulon-like protein B8 [Tanacetum cinerariifolium]